MFRAAKDEPFTYITTYNQTKILLLEIANSNQLSYKTLTQKT